MLKIELRPTREGTPGQGELLIQGWKQGASALEFAVRNNQNDGYLDGAGKWGASKYWNSLADVREEDGKLLAQVGACLVDPLLKDRTMTYLLYLQNADGSDQGVLSIDDSLLSSTAIDKTRREKSKQEQRQKEEQEKEQKEAQRAEQEEKQEEQEKQQKNKEEEQHRPDAPAEPAKRTQSRWLRWLLLLLFAILVAGLAWWLIPRFMQSPADIKAGGEAGACSAPVLAENPDDLALIQSCLKTSPSSDEVLALISAAKENKRCNLVQRLYAHKAQSGDAVIALAYAREYDPANFKAGGCIESADAETASYWYELALERDPSQSVARERLEALKK
ncbi:hypothetical protein AXE65_00330 [Ventosimonas gracilis]|uniref:Uncharacterized protein n=1 Tax=Ventosimonas gracilis TaxID=1680762 RepID=A0A139SU13_9GAMM|nr:hypothetical protein [Ventosimonas gracilis]KXU38004.1 hypothetical protein AXE65_00330 [Ventosimonas gracilis]